MSQSAPGNPQRSSIAALSGLFGTKLRRILGYAVAAAAAVVMLAWGIIGMIGQPPLDTHPTRFDGKIGQVTSNPPEPVMVPPAASPAAAPPAPREAAPAVIGPPAAVVAPAAIAPSNLVRLPKMRSEQVYEVTPPPPPADPKATAEKHEASQTGPGTRVAFKPTEIPGGRAGKAMRLDYVMLPQSIECALDTAMDSTFAGFVRCHTTHDVESPSHVTLMPAGTLISGAYKNEVRTGQTRIYAFAANAFTPEGIPVPLDSSLGDGYGRTGVGGEVDNHYVERFGAALALTGFQSAIGIAEAALSKGGNSYFSFNSGGGVQDLATEILHQQGNIPPTITVPPGTIVSVIVDHPVSFEDAIKVTTRERQ